MTVYDYINGEPLLGEMTIEEAEPIIECMIDLAVNEISYQTGCDIERKWIEEDLADAEWIYSINVDDEPCRVDMELCEKQIDIITERCIKYIKDDME